MQASFFGTTAKNGTIYHTNDGAFVLVQYTPSADETEVYITTHTGEPLWHTPIATIKGRGVEKALLEAGITLAKVNV